MYDVAIIGAGPAGTTLARLLACQYRVLLVERRALDGPERFDLRKCCGGLLAPDAQAMLSRLGLGLPKSVLQEPQLFVVRAIDMPRRLERFYQRHYINMDRLRFDRWLLSMVPADVDLRLGCRLRDYALEGGGVTLTLRGCDQTYHERARLLVGADGATSRVRSLLMGRPAWPRRYLAIQDWVETTETTPYFSSVFDPTITDYYGWTIPKDNYLVLGTALPLRSRPLERFELLKQRLRDWGLRFGPTARRETALLLRPMSTRELSTGTAHVALLGEAGGWISPSSAEGLSYAMRSALALADALRPGLAGFNHRYRRRTTSLRKSIFLKTLKSRVIFSPTLRHLIMRLGICTMAIREG